MGRERGKWFQDKAERKAAKAFAKTHEMRVWEAKHYGPLNGKKKRPLDHTNFYVGHFVTDTMEKQIGAGTLVLKPI